MTDNGDVRPYVDHQRRVFITRSGAELHLKPVPALVVERLFKDQSGKPQVPMVDVLIGGKHSRSEPNPNDPAYLNALNDWTLEHQMKVFQYVIWKGIDNATPKDFVKEHRQFLPDATEPEMKYLWIGSLLENLEDIRLLVDAIIGQTAITEQGLEQAVQSFPGDGEQSGYSGVPAGESAG